MSEPCTSCGRDRLAPGERQTCIHCLGATRRRITEMVTYARHLPDQAIRGQNGDPHGEHIPGGAALVMAGPWSNHHHEIGSAAYTYRDDPNPPWAVLATWGHDWQHWLKRDSPGNEPRIGWDGFLLENLTHAAQWHPAFDQFVAEIREAHSALEAVLHDGIRDEIGVHCIRCDNPPRLRAAYVDPGHQPTTTDVNYGQIGLSHDQGGRRDWWACPKCHELYTPKDYLLATTDEMQAREAS